jgi:hypothetical protein
MYLPTNDSVPTAPRLDPAVSSGPRIRNEATTAVALSRLLQMPQLPWTMDGSDIINARALVDLHINSPLLFHS